jgi:hypothetical protein
MKAIINGVRYDTEKATLIGEASEGNRGDFGRWEAGLYVTPRAGRYFLAGEGGPMSRYARPGDQPGAWRSGERIEPLSREMAFAWAQDNLPVQVVEAHFGDLIEDA